MVEGGDDGIFCAGGRGVDEQGFSDGKVTPCINIRTSFLLVIFLYHATKVALLIG